MRIRLLKDYAINTIFSHLQDGKIEIENLIYNGRFGELIPTKLIEEGQYGYTIDFGELEKIKGICINIPKDIIEFISNEFAQPIPGERCCNHG
jgi:hypothetical protein